MKALFVCFFHVEVWLQPAIEFDGHVTCDKTPFMAGDIVIPLSSNESCTDTTQHTFILSHIVLKYVVNHTLLVVAW